jgi:hypothetical protein
MPLSAFRASESHEITTIEVFLDIEETNFFS